MSPRWQWWTPKNSFCLPNTLSHVDNLSLVPWSQYYAFLVGHPPVELWVDFSELSIYFRKNILLFLSNIVGKSFQLVQCCSCCHSKELNRWSLHVGCNNSKRFQFQSYKYHLTFTGICCWREACKELSEPECSLLPHWDQELAGEYLQHYVIQWRTGQSMHQWHPCHRLSFQRRVNSQRVAGLMAD